MAKVACKECGGVVSDWASKCPHCGVSNPGVTAKHYVVGGGFLVVLFFLLAVWLGGGESVPSLEERLAETETVADVIEAVTRRVPSSAYAIESTAYMAVIFQTNSASPRGHLLDVKRLMPVLLERYPQVDRFFFAWTHDGTQQYMKVQLDRPTVEHVRWQAVMVDEIEGLTSMYWMVPALR